MLIWKFRLLRICNHATTRLLADARNNPNNFNALLERRVHLLGQYMVKRFGLDENGTKVLEAKRLFRERATRAHMKRQVRISPVKSV